MNTQIWQAWGSCSLWFKLPAASVQLTGLSNRQLASLKEIYPDFIDDTMPDAAEYDIECCAYRLDHRPLVSSGALSRNGQYAPRKKRYPNKDGIELTGINFEARIGLKSPLAPASLGVADEHELVKANVIENFLRVFSAHRALDQGGVVLHSAGLVFDDKAYIFSGHSNAGKTTLTRKAYQKGARVLSDDINLLLPDAEGYQAHAVPFTGEFGRTLDHQGSQDSYPVVGIILLQQGDSLNTETVNASDAVATLLTGCPFVNDDEVESAVLFDSVTALVEKLPVIRLISRRDDNIEQIMSDVKKQFADEQDR